ncbi:GTP cyclohydrolase FolE2 [Niallia sp. 01092]|uniref:GTP cyclohydrolase FolE2 n=1 Tax=unclassified Niallia TaxID=2837522 RepID=UPI003FCF5B73
MKTTIQLPNKLERHRHFGSVDPIKNRTKPEEKENMTDLQNTPKDYFFEIDHVGISNVSHPINITSSMEPNLQTTIGTFTITTNLVRDRKGINMSRLTELLQEYYEHGWILDMDFLQAFTKEIAERMSQHKSSLSVSFPWYYERKAPVTSKKGFMHSSVSLETSYDQEKGWKSFIGLEAAVTTLCPCSKEISEYSAHNQRGIVKIKVELHPSTPWPSDIKKELLNVAESNASSMLHPVLKRPDEKKVTEQAYENPRFVEDFIRLIAADLYELDWVKSFDIECRNEESIHLHDAYARLSFDKD